MSWVSGDWRQGDQLISFLNFAAGEFQLLLAGFALGALLASLLTVLLVRRSAKIEALERESALQQDLNRVQADARVELSHADASLEAIQAKLKDVQQTLHSREQLIENLRKVTSQLQSRLAAQGVRLEEERNSAQEKLNLLDEARDKLSGEFQNLANRIFDEKSDRFSKSSKTLLDSTLGPLRDQLAEFRRRVDNVYASDSEGRVKLLHEISSLKSINQRMSEEAVNLTRALKGDSKAQGSWGEVVLERVLEESGLTRGREYETQLSLSDDAGRRRLPDVVVRLPEGKDVVIDAKVSLLDYERYCNAVDDTERNAALSAHMRSLKNHIEGLSIKDYEGLQGLRSLDFVLVFVPIESAFVAALEGDSDLFRRAYDRNIIVVSPTTLLATLRTIQSIWRYERQNRHAEQIASRAGKLHDQFVLVLESLGELGRSLDKARESFDATLGRFTDGRGNLVRQVEMLGELGAKTRKQIPEAIRERAALDEDRQLLDADEADTDNDGDADTE